MTAAPAPHDHSELLMRLAEDLPALCDGEINATPVRTWGDSGDGGYVRYVGDVGRDVRALLDALSAANATNAGLKSLALAFVGYAVHDDDCTVNRFPEHEACSCGLRPVIREVTALAATQGSEG